LLCAQTEKFFQPEFHNNLNSRKIILYRNRREPNGEILSGKATRIKDLSLLLRNG